MRTWGSDPFHVFGVDLFLNALLLKISLWSHCTIMLCACYLSQVTRMCQIPWVIALWYSACYHAYLTWCSQVITRLTRMQKLVMDDSPVLCQACCAATVHHPLNIHPSIPDASCAHSPPPTQLTGHPHCSHSGGTHRRAVCGFVARKPTRHTLAASHLPPLSRLCQSSTAWNASPTCQLQPPSNLATAAAVRAPAGLSEAGASLRCVKLVGRDTGCRAYEPVRCSRGCGTCVAAPPAAPGARAAPCDVLYCTVWGDCEGGSSGGSEKAPAAAIGFISAWMWSSRRLH